MRAALLLLALALAVAACQVTDPEGQVSVGDTAGAADPADEPVLGSPEEEWPRTIAALRATALPEAQTWQDDPTLADLTVFISGGEWQSVRLTYVAADAERMLIYRSTPDTLRLERPQLEGLQLVPVPAARVEEIQPFPDSALEPAALAEASASALASCGAEGEEAAAVLYSTGAPATWNGAEWTRLPSWRATVVTASVGVVVDPTSGQAFAPLTCVDPLLVNTD